MNAGEFWRQLNFLLIIFALPIQLILEQMSGLSFSEMFIYSFKLIMNQKKRKSYKMHTHLFLRIQAKICRVEPAVQQYVC
jgi:hypothetical protein